MVVRMFSSFLSRDVAFGNSYVYLDSPTEVDSLGNGVASEANAGRVEGSLISEDGGGGGEVGAMSRSAMCPPIEPPMWRMGVVEEGWSCED